MRNVLAKVPQKLKQEVADDIRSIFYASSKDKALEFASQFTGRWQKGIPSAVKCLQNSLDSCLTFFDFPEEEWISLPTTLAFISIKMEIHWRSNPVGKVRYNLPSLRK